MVVKVRCSAAACRKYQLVEEADRGHSVKCLICQSPIHVPMIGSVGGSNPGSNPGLAPVPTGQAAPPPAPLRRAAQQHPTEPVPQAQIQPTDDELLGLE